MKKNLLIILLGIIFIFLHCTNPFAVRSPEKPVIEQPNGNMDLQKDPKGLLKKIQIAFQGPRIEYYDECLTDSTNFVFAPQQLEKKRLAGWKRREEVVYFRNFVKSDSLSEFNMVYDIISFSETAPDSAWMEISYQITAQVMDKHKKYQGRSIMNVFRSRQFLWFICKWEDLKGPGGSDSTWSTLKANYRY